MEIDYVFAAKLVRWIVLLAAIMVSVDWLHAFVIRRITAAIRQGNYECRGYDVRLLLAAALLASFYAMNI